MRLLYSLTAVAAAVLVLGGCATQQKKMPCTDIDVLTKFKREIYVLKSQDISAESEAKFRAAKTLYQNVDFSFARDTNTLMNILGAHDARHGMILDNHAIIYQYSWNNEYVRLAFMGEGRAITGCEIKMDKFKNKL